MSGHCVTLFGMAGTGKTFIGEHLSDKTGWHFLDGDALFTETDIAHLKEVTFTDAMRDAYHQRLVDEIESRMRMYHTCIVATCLVKQRHRDLFLRNFGRRITLVHVHIEDTLAIQRMAKREHFFPPEKYLALKAKYDPVATEMPCFRFNNDEAGSLDDLLQQLVKEMEYVSEAS